MNTQSKSWLKSTFGWVIAVPALGALFCLLDGFIALTSDRPRSDEHAGIAFIVGGICLVVTGAFIAIARDVAERREKALGTVEPSSRSQKWAAQLDADLDEAAWKESGLNPDNSDRARRALKGEPDIG